MVIATQNPVEQAGTYRLPEAQLDRFLMQDLDRLPRPRVDGASSWRRARPRPRGHVAAADHPEAVLDMADLADDGARRPVGARLRRRSSPRRPARSPHVRLGCVGARLPGARPGGQDLGGRRTGATTSMPDDVKALAEPVLGAPAAAHAEARVRRRHGGRGPRADPGGRRAAGASRMRTVPALGIVTPLGRRHSARRRRCSCWRSGAAGRSSRSPGSRCWLAC